MSGLTCPKCKSVDHGVSDSRPAPHGLRRRRLCGRCRTRFTTLELVVDGSPIAIAPTGTGGAYQPVPLGQYLADLHGRVTAAVTRVFIERPAFDEEQG